MKNESTALARQREKHVMRKGRGDTDLELSSTFSLIVLTRASLWGRSSLLSIRLPLLSLHHVPQPTELFFSVFSILPTTLTVFSFEFLLPIKTSCQFTADTFLFLTQVSAAIVIWISGTYFTPSHLFFLFRICFFLFHHLMVDQ